MVGFLDTLRTGAWLTRERIRLIALALLAASVIGAGFLIVTSDGLNDRLGRPLGTDFANVYAAGTYVLGGEAAARKRAALTSLASLRVARDEDRAIVPALKTVRALRDAARHIPTVVIVGAPYPKERLARAWRAAEIAPAARADHAWILDAPGASHVSPLARDRAYIDAAVGWLRAPFVTASKAGATLDRP